MISILIINSIKKAETYIVPAKWIKKICAEKAGVNESKITVVPPKINVSVKRYFDSTLTNMKTYFYPAAGEVYKNHKLIVDAVKILREQQDISDYTVIFTLRGDENKHVSKLFKQVKENNLPIEFIGTVTREQVFEYYSRSTLIFPSYIETFGLPLLEAKMHNAPVIASDMPFSHEILDGYEHVQFIGVDDVRGLASLIKRNFNINN